MENAHSGLRREREGECERGREREKGVGENRKEKAKAMNAPQLKCKEHREQTSCIFDNSTEKIPCSKPKEARRFVFIAITVNSRTF